MRRLRPFTLVLVLLAAGLAAKAGLLGERLTVLAMAPRLVSDAEASTSVPAAAGGHDAPAKPQAKAAAAPACDAQASPLPQPPTFSDAEIAVLQQLGERRRPARASSTAMPRCSAPPRRASTRRWRSSSPCRRLWRA